ncbi:exported hypothetical protein [Candidatus Nitrospira nitrosa]|uniref:Uncharacterized protein n=1 Tax=Candidatus Nitrospira nitrosa TaxID=1742972 RepID=A0A0S4L6G4_9BACT|nr:Dickkopf N-terminal cysteine-rich domain-containing protein [Candidatus Nitrospira nitrosa]CUS32298.1 exported hypothetical protein [Candidatus Nitrospira nitrosa]
MKSIWGLMSLGLVLLTTPAYADLCDSVKDKTTTSETKKDVDFYEELFPSAVERGHRMWNEIILQCNRQRDTKGNDVAKITANAGTSADKQILKARDVEPKVIRGHYNFFGTFVTQLKYVYVLSKQDGIWTMIIPYRPIINDVVPDRVDFNFTHAGQLYDASQLESPAGGGKAQSFILKPGAVSIATTLCSTTTYFPGDAGKYDKKEIHQRDPENKFISLGRIDYQYGKDGSAFSGCRVDKTRDLYWRPDPAENQAAKVKPEDWILDNFVRTAENYWSIKDLFQLKLLMKGRNESQFPKSTLNLLEDDDHLTIRFATKFLPYDFNQMYKSNLIQFNNFSTMTTDGTYWHEVGHAFGLDDEYGKVKDKKDGIEYKDNGCDNEQYANWSPKTYQMCDAGVSEKRTIYHYLAVSRYITKQKECNADNDCGNGEYCNAGVDLKKNQCMAKKPDNETCDIAGGDHQCKSGYCKLSRCYTPNSVPMGETCYLNDACREGKCSSLDGTKGTCVCQADTDCGTGKYCNAGLDATKNSCLMLKNDNETCDIAGGDHQCKSGYCKLSRCYTPNSVPMGGTCYLNDACKEGKCSSLDGTKGTCVCKADADCGPGKWCDAGIDTTVNACRPKLNKGEKCGKLGSFGNDHKCKSGECSGAPKYECK